MKSRVAQYLNEIVSITVMLLMTAALIAGQAPTADARAKALDGTLELNAVLGISAD